jgi:hypothetical protein
MGYRGRGAGGMSADPAYVRTEHLPHLRPRLLQLAAEAANSCGDDSVALGTLLMSLKRENLNIGKDAARDLLAEARGKPQPVNGTAPKLYPIISDTEAESLPPPEWGIDEVYPQGGLVLLFGPRGIGKTFVTLGWSFAHAATGEWLGRSALRGPVLYILAEGRGGLGVRVRAQKEHLGIEGHAGVYFITQAVPTLDAAELARLIATIKALPEPPVAVVWDTLSRTFVGGDENTSKDMATYVDNTDRVGEACGNLTRIIIHHSGHNSTDRERGSSVLGAAADSIIAMRERDGLLEVACEKQKDAGEFDPIFVQLQEAAESRVISLHDPRGVTDGILTSVEKVALRSLHESFLDDGAATTPWMAASGMVSSSFYKARTALVRKGLVDQKGTGKGARYVLTAHGRALVLLHTPRVTP